MSRGDDNEIFLISWNWLYFLKQVRYSLFTVQVNSIYGDNDDVITEGHSHRKRQIGNKLRSKETTTKCSSQSSHQILCEEQKDWIVESSEWGIRTSVRAHTCTERDLNWRPYSMSDKCVQHNVHVNQDLLRYLFHRIWRGVYAIFAYIITVI